MRSTRFAFGIGIIAAPVAAAPPASAEAEPIYVAQGKDWKHAHRAAEKRALLEYLKSI